MDLAPERQALLKQKEYEYISSMETPGTGINYNLLATDRLLILEAINDWSGRALSEGGDIRFTYECDDPCCATDFELIELASRMHCAPIIFYPASGFVLSDEDELRFGYFKSSFRMVAHIGGSRAHGIGIAESRHIQDVEAALQLWAFCATEDCIAYLNEQMDAHNLTFDEEGYQAVRQIITSAILDRFSIGQVWNAMWRTVKDAAALSTREYYNKAKAAKTIPKKLDRVLTLADGDPSFEAYDRIETRPLGALLTLFLQRFGITDSMIGAQVRAKLTADAALAARDASDDDEIDEGRGLIMGTMFFMHHFTELDRLLLSCFRGLETEHQEPLWDEDHVVGWIDYHIADISFDGKTFIAKLFALLGLALPSDIDFTRHAAAAKQYRADTGKWLDETGWCGAISEVLVKGGVPRQDADIISSYFRSYPALDDVVRILPHIPVPAGLCGIRVTHAHVYPGYVEQSDCLFVENFAISMPEMEMMPDHSDVVLFRHVMNKDFGYLAEVFTSSILQAVYHADEKQKNHLLTLIANNLLDQSKPPAEEDIPEE